MNRLSARRQPLSKGETLLFALLPLGILGFVVSGLWLRRGDETPRIVFPTPAALPNPNGFDFYVAAARAIRPAKPSVDPVDGGRWVLTTNPKLAAQNYSLKRRLAHLSANRAGFALVQQGLHTPSRFNPVNGFSAFGSLRQLAREKVIESNTFILQKRWNEATQSSLDAIQMGNDIARGGPLMARLMGTSVAALGRESLGTDQAVPERLNAAQAKSAARRLEAILTARPTYADALKGGKWASLAEFQAVVKNGNWRALATQNNTETTWRERFATQFLSAREVNQRISDAFDRAAADVQKPFGAAPAPAPKLDPISAAFAPEIQSLRFSDGREQVQLNVLLLRFALRAYRLENGAFPDNLNLLVPKYLKKIPTDYFASGAPFRYRKSGRNYDLWSVGPDQIDNGGVPIKSRDYGGPVPAPLKTNGANQSGRFPAMMNDSTGDYVAGKNR